MAHAFTLGSSGLFGDELPGPWLSDIQVIEAYRPVFPRYALTGDDPFVRKRMLRVLLRKFGFRTSRYDTHARAR